MSHRKRRRRGLECRVGPLAAEQDDVVGDLGEEGGYLVAKLAGGALADRDRTETSLSAVAERSASAVGVDSHDPLGERLECRPIRGREPSRDDRHQADPMPAGAQLANEVVVAEVAARERPREAIDQVQHAQAIRTPGHGADAPSTTVRQIW
jgi:hypothetical protein